MINYKDKITKLLLKWDKQECDCANPCHRFGIWHSNQLQMIAGFIEDVKEDD